MLWHNSIGAAAELLHKVVEEPSELLFVWSVSKFMGRLDMMRDIYHNWMSGISFTVDLKEDPWVEAGPVELEFWMREKEEDVWEEKLVLQATIEGLQTELKRAQRAWTADAQVINVQTRSAASGSDMKTDTSD